MGFNGIETLVDGRAFLVSADTMGNEPLWCQGLVPQGNGVTTVAPQREVEVADVFCNAGPSWQ